MSSQTPPSSRNQLKRLRFHIQGRVQGVGFRPFVFRTAHQHHLVGFVQNTNQGVTIEAEGKQGDLDSFLEALQNPPPLAKIEKLESTDCELLNSNSFEVVLSERKGIAQAQVMPDIATCAQCIQDIFDPENRRFGYPFTNCTDCGPRFTITHKLPYDRPETSMRDFALCQDCQEEYNNPSDRRFHAQPNACSICGPQVFLTDNSGVALSEKNLAIEQARQALVDGKIVALMGLGGYQLLVDATRSTAVNRLRTRKNRPAKPLAIMFSQLNDIRQHCDLHPAEEKALVSPQNPIVLLQKTNAIFETGEPGLCEEIAFAMPRLGVMLPTTPLHHILLKTLPFPVVATSGNRRGESICITHEQALQELGDIADVFLSHNRPILRGLDDSIVQVIRGEAQILRMARGYAPLPLSRAPTTQPDGFAAGAHQKNAIAFSHQKRYWLSPYIGDMDSVSNQTLFTKRIHSLQNVQQLQPQCTLHDLHEGYFSTQYAQHRAHQLQHPNQRVQHHKAHMFACIAEHQLKGPTLGIIWDGTGKGEDDTIWGGEWFILREKECQRVCSLKPFQLPGNAQAIRDPRRSALGLLYAWRKEAALELSLDFLDTFASNERKLLSQMLQKNLRSPMCSSVGRWFDAMAALLGFHRKIHFEAEAAIYLEHLQNHHEAATKAFPLHFCENTHDSEPDCYLDWRPLVEACVNELQRGTDKDILARRFHLSLQKAIVDSAKRFGIEQVVLSGGCFQNRTLLSEAIDGLQNAGFRVYWPKQVPPNDGGIALGQLAYVDWHAM